MPVSKTLHRLEGFGTFRHSNSISNTALYHVLFQDRQGPHKIEAEILLENKVGNLSLTVTLKQLVIHPEEICERVVKVSPCN